MQTSGLVAGLVTDVQDHPNADYIKLAHVYLGDGEPVQIVFGGPPIVDEGDLVLVAPPGSRLGCTKIRRRRYRGQLSHGMLCSLVEIGWEDDGPHQVALLRNVAPGQSLDAVADQFAILQGAPEPASKIVISASGAARVPSPDVSASH